MAKKVTVRKSFFKSFLKIPESFNNALDFALRVLVLVMPVNHPILTIISDFNSITYG